MSLDLPIEPAGDLARSWPLTYTAKPGTLNAERKAHWSKRAAATAEWRQAFWALARQAKVPKLNRVTLDVRVECRTRQMPDPGGIWPAVKAAEDGLVDAGVIPDDTGVHVLWLRMWAPEHTGRDALTVTVGEVQSMRRYVAARREQERALTILRRAGATEDDLDRFSLAGGYAVFSVGVPGVVRFDSVEDVAAFTVGRSCVVVVNLDRIWCSPHEVQS